MIRHLSSFCAFRVGFMRWSLAAPPHTTARYMYRNPDGKRPQEGVLRCSRLAEINKPLWNPYSVFLIRARQWRVLYLPSKHSLTPLSRTTKIQRICPGQRGIRDSGGDFGEEIRESRIFVRDSEGSGATRPGTAGANVLVGV